MKYRRITCSIDIPIEEWIPLNLGKMYYYGIETEPDLDKALEYFRAAAAAGNQEAAAYIKSLVHPE